MSVKAIPDGYQTATPYLSIKGAAAAIEFYQRAFNAVEIFRLEAPNGDIGHAEIKVGNSPIMLSDSCEDTAFKDPDTLNGTSIVLYLYVEDVDVFFAQAVEAGATIVTPIEDQFYGDRNGTLKDPFGHFWFVASHKEDLTPDELSERARKLFSHNDN
jgi:PhnB protein